jgi:hypothetical protein
VEILATRTNQSAFLRKNHDMLIPLNFLKLKVEAQTKRLPQATSPGSLSF